MKVGADGQKPNRGGRPLFVPTDEQKVLVERLTAISVSVEVIAREWLKPPIAKGTLRRAFRHELQLGRSGRPFAGLLLRLLRRAEHGHLGAQIYLLNRLCPDFAQERGRVTRRPDHRSLLRVIARNARHGPADRGGHRDAE